MRYVLPLGRHKLVTGSVTRHIGRAAHQRRGSRFSVPLHLRLAVRPQTVHTWRLRKQMPQPRWSVSGQPAWDWSEIEAWAVRTGRLRVQDVHAGLAELEGMGWDGDL